MPAKLSPDTGNVINARLFVTKKACLKCGRPTKKGSFCKHCAEEICAELDGTSMPHSHTKF